MFNKTLFNRNAFDRSVSLPSVSALISSQGTLKLAVVMRVSMFAKTFSGVGSMNCGVVMRQHMDLEIQGEGVLAEIPVTLATTIRPIRFSGSGTLTPGAVVITPFRGAIIGTGNMELSNKVQLIQQIPITITSTGILDTGLVVQKAIPILFEGGADLHGDVSLHLPLPMEIVGTGEMVLRRLSALNESILELIDIDIAPGDTITIDTDLLQVLIGSKEDVSSVTSDSIFFELNPGENEITISSDSGSQLEVVTIWQNRWL